MDCLLDKGLVEWRMGRREMEKLVVRRGIGGSIFDEGLWGIYGVG